MIFLIHYSRADRRLMSMEPFADRDEASQAKLHKELLLLTSGSSDEVVLLESDSEESLRKTHRRYFESLDALKSSEADAYSSAQARFTKYWVISEKPRGWLVQAEGVPDGLYPTREGAVAAAAKDSKDWARSTGNRTGIRIHRRDGSSEELGQAQ